MLSGHSTFKLQGSIGSIEDAIGGKGWQKEASFTGATRTL